MLDSQQLKEPELGKIRQVRKITTQGHSAGNNLIDKNTIYNQSILSISTETVSITVFHVNFVVIAKIRILQSESCELVRYDIHHALPNNVKILTISRKQMLYSAYACKIMQEGLSNERRTSAEYNQPFEAMQTTKRCKKIQTNARPKCH